MAASLRAGMAPGRKATKAQAHYRDGTPRRHCGICDHFMPPAACNRVSGEIRPSMLCDYYMPKGGGRRARKGAF